MTCLLWLVVVAFSAALLFWRVSLRSWSLSVGFVLIVVSIAVGDLPFSLWVPFLIIASLNIIPFRRSISDPVLGLFRKILPHLSQTEREALEAGTVGWDAEIVSGNPQWEKLLNIPTPKLTEEEQAFLDGPVEDLCKMIDEWKATEEYRDLSPEVWAFIKSNGFFGMIIPRRFGGLEFSALAHSSVVMKVATRSVSAAVTIMVPNSLGPAELLLHYGTEEQQNYYLPRLARGEEVPSFALTGPEAGSDAGAMPDSGVICHGKFEGKEVLGIRLNWQKRYITLGPVATLLGLAFKLYDPDRLLGDQEELGITCALVRTDLPGIDISRRHIPLNAVFQNGPNSGKDVFIPVDWIIGGAAGAGQGWRMLMECLAAGRSISLPAMSTGAGKLASRMTGAYARIREQFNMPIGYFEGVEEALARIAGITYMMDSARMATAGMVDQGEKPSVISAIVKYHLTEGMRQVLNDAMDIQGGSAICMGPRNLIGPVYQIVPVGITVEGANILTRSMIIFGQGAICCHPYILTEMHAAADPDKKHALELFDQAFWGHVGFSLSNTVRSFVLGISDGYGVTAPVKSETKRYFQRLTRMSSALAISIDIALMTLGGALKRREKLSARFADVLSQLYLISCTLKRFEDDGCPKHDLPIVRWVCDNAFYTIQQSFDGVIKNLPNRPVAWLLRILIFPLGRRYSVASDELGHQVARLLLSPSATRDRLTHGIFIASEPGEHSGLIEDALQKVVAAEAAEKSLHAAIKAGKISSDHATLIEQSIELNIISAEEGALIEASKAARNAVIQVDDFSEDELKR
ncbi:Acyl-coenzyme A dehydrogenase FadE [hydrothermal vent metagenome]|uniref:Acyl-coenzyme A dehydrogenase n=1 Tax=hydrothermal vent metagenome TaxID=652676 RepID=A0A3B1AN90_9ZZZZ